MGDIVQPHTVIVAFIAVCTAIMLFFMLKRKCLFKGILASVFQGVAALYAVKLLGLVTGVSVAVNWYTLGTAAVLGSPGVVLMLAAQTIFH
ncbi:MAG: pro-sigmaK processing inhibitor BofA family protein [Clostridia bacterium]|nr:pro-sigmaK processing inhibitor BofA family protein [Clostridia bacterium]